MSFAYVFGEALAEVTASTDRGGSSRATQLQSVNALPPPRKIMANRWWNSTIGWRREALGSGSWAEVWRSAFCPCQIWFRHSFIANLHGLATGVRTTSFGMSSYVPLAESRRSRKDWGAPDSSFWAVSLHPLQKSKNQKIRKSKNGASEYISVTRHNSGTNHRTRKLKTLKDTRSSDLWTSIFQRIWRFRFVSTNRKEPRLRGRT